MKNIGKYLTLIKLWFHYQRRNNQPPLYPIILKCDDLNRISKQVKILDFCVKCFSIKVSWGIIGKSLQNPTTPYVAWIKKRYATGKYHFFNHGYLHLCDKSYEFDQQPVSYQRDMLWKTQTLAKEHLGITLNTFGAPANHIDLNTSLALKDFPEIKYWYYGLKGEDLFPIALPRSINVEKKVGLIDFAFFKNEWINRPKNPAGEIITLQMHPNMWHHIQFLQFCVVIAFLRSERAYFITPDDLVKQESL